MKIFIAFISILWSGMIFAISFIEAPLKFKAPFVTEKIGLGIGQLVFHALNKVEWIMSIVILIVLFLYQPSFKILLLIIFPILILSIQTFVLYPILDFRVNEILTGNDVNDSLVHLIFIFLELAKFLVLIGSSLVVLKL